MNSFILPILDACADGDCQKIENYSKIMLEKIDSEIVYPYFVGISNLVSQEPNIKKKNLIKKTIDLTDKISNEEYEEAARLKGELDKNPLYRKYVAREL